MGIEQFGFGKTRQGQVIDAYRITNSAGASAEIMTYGGRLLTLKVPDRAGKSGDVVLGYDSLESYGSDTSGQGALIGRYGNRIGGAQFTLGGRKISLARNDGENHLHGGRVGFSARIWDAAPVDGRSLRLQYVSPDGEENYPGTLQVSVTYTLTDRNELVIHYSAVSDQDTIVNLTNHSYFNLENCTDADILSHELQIESDAITAADSALIPTGELMPVTGTPFDFTSPKPIGRDIDEPHPQLRIAGGYDHNFVLRSSGIRRVATLYSPKSGRRMDVLTDQCGMQVYSANFLNNPDAPLRGGRAQQPRIALCLETQHYPDSPNHPEFPTCLLRAGERYDTTTIYAFSVQ